VSRERTAGERKTMIDRSHELPLVGQGSALGISRGSVFYLARPTSDADLALMRRIDELHLEHPFAGSRMLRDMRPAEGRDVGRLHVSTLMKSSRDRGPGGAAQARRTGVEAIYRRPNTSKPGPGHKIYPYLLRNLAVTRPNQVWATDITYVPMARGFVYLVAIVDWFSRRVLAWRLSITLSADFCVEALEEALAGHGKPEILNADQGSQFTSADFVKVLKDAEIAISMDGRGAWRDNVFVERLWRTIKYEEVYLRAYGGVTEARASIGRYIGFYNGTRPHSSLGGRRPDQAYVDLATPIPAAA
jgi:putative transposase